MLGSKQKTLHKSFLKFDPGRSFPGGVSETLISADLGAAKTVPEAGNASTIALLTPQVVVRALTNSGGEAPNDLPFAISLDVFAEWILAYREGDKKSDAFEYLQPYWEYRIQLNNDGWLDEDSVVLPYLLEDNLVNRTTHKGGGSEGTFTAFLQQNKDGGAIWGQIKYTPINLVIMQLGAIALLNEVFLTQDYESVAVPAASAVRAITRVYLSRDVENLRDEDMDVFTAILSEYQAVALGIAASSDPRSDLAELLPQLEVQPNPTVESLELGESILGDAISNQARAAREAILQKLELTSFEHLGDVFANDLIVATLVEIVWLMGGIATEEYEDESSPVRRSASAAIQERLEGPRGLGDFTRRSVALFSAIYVADAQTDDESDEDIANQIEEIYDCADLSSSERAAVEDARQAWVSEVYDARVDDWFERNERKDTSLPPATESEREWFEKSFKLLVCDALDLHELSEPDPELIQWWAAALTFSLIARDQLIAQLAEALTE